MSWVSDFIKKKVDEGLQNISSGYGNWINGVVENVQSGIQQGIDYVKNSMGTSSGQDTTTPPATTPQTSTPTTPATTPPTSTPQTTTPTTPTTTPTQTTPTTTPETPSVTTPPATALVTTPQTSTPQTSTPTTTEPTTTPESTPPESTPPTSTPEVATGFDTYQDFLGNNMQNIDNMYTNTVTTLDKQNGETLKQIDETLKKGEEYATDVKETTDAALEAQKNADIDYAETQRDLLKETSRAEKDAVYKYAEETLAGALGYNQEAYGKLVEAITSQMEAGKLAAREAKNLLMIMAEEAKNTTYGAAERQRQEAESQADINRQRAIADANSAYEQNKASYGAKAEALGNMGLSGGGYGDWLNSSAYAQNRSEVQGAKARSDAAKREAKYTEDMTKLQADQEYSNKKYQAESEYQNKLYDIDTSYRTNMSEAEQSKLAADKAAQDAEREAKRQADSKHSENVYNADSNYADWVNKADTTERQGKLQSDIEYKGFLYDIETEADKSRLETNQNTELKKLEASNNYITAIMQNEGELAKFKEALKAEDKQAQQVQLSMYEKVLKGVSDGTYTAEDAAALANAFEFSQEWKDEIANAAGRKEETDAGIKAEQDQQQRVQNFGTLLEKGKTGALTAEEIKTMAAELGFDVNNPEDEKLINLAVAAADGYATASDEEKKYQKNMNVLTLLDGAKTGAYGVDEIDNIASMLGLDPEKDKGLINMIKTAAGNYADGVTKSEDQQKMNTFINLLGSANAGELTKDELSQIASELGLSDEQKTLLTTAAGRYQTGSEEEKSAQKTMNFISLLDGANTGAYNSEQIAQMAEMLGLDPKNEADAKFIGMLKTAADDFAAGEAGKTAKEDMQYQNGVYAELLAAANNGDYTEAQIKDLANRFGIEDPDNILGDAAKLAQESKKNEAENLVKGESASKTLEIKGMLAGDTTDEYIDDYVEAGYITEEDGAKLKEDRNTVAKKEVNDLIKSGNYNGAIERADELRELGYIDEDTYQTAYFEASISNVQQVKGAKDIQGVVSDLFNLYQSSKITGEDFDNLVDYMYQNAGAKLDRDKYSLTEKETWPGVYNVDISIGDANVAFNSSQHVEIHKADSETSNMLNKIEPNASKGDLIMFDNKLYVYYNDKWMFLNNTSTNWGTDTYEEYNKLIARQPKIEPPKHTPRSATQEK